MHEFRVAVIATAVTLAIGPMSLPAREIGTVLVENVVLPENDTDLERVLNNVLEKDPNVHRSILALSSFARKAGCAPELIVRTEVGAVDGDGDAYTLTVSLVHGATEKTIAVYSTGLYLSAGTDGVRRSVQIGLSGALKRSAKTLPTKLICSRS